eukprot:1921971-Pyramimonas_sp.AAC.1
MRRRARAMPSACVNGRAPTRQRCGAALRSSIHALRRRAINQSNKVNREEHDGAQLRGIGGGSPAPPDTPKNTQRRRGSTAGTEFVRASGDEVRIALEAHIAHAKASPNAVEFAYFLQAGERIINFCNGEAEFEPLRGADALQRRTGRLGPVGPRRG